MYRRATRLNIYATVTERARARICKLTINAGASPSSLALAANIYSLYRPMRAHTHTTTIAGGTPFSRGKNIRRYFTEGFRNFGKKKEKSYTFAVTYANSME